MVRRITVVGVLVGASLALVPPASAAPAATGVAVIAGKPTEFKYTFSKMSVAKGAVTFTVTNKGKLPHNLKIGGKKSATLKPGRTTAVNVLLKAGKAAYLCTLPGHAAGGMKGTLTVR